MVVVFILTQAEFGRNGHREDIPDFTFYEVFVVFVNAACCYDSYIEYLRVAPLASFEIEIYVS